MEQKKMVVLWWFYFFVVGGVMMITIQLLMIIKKIVWVWLHVLYWDVNKLYWWWHAKFSHTLLVCAIYDFYGANIQSWGSWWTEKKQKNRWNMQHITNCNKINAINLFVSFFFFSLFLFWWPALWFVDFLSHFGFTVPLRIFSFLSRLLILRVLV